MHVLVFCKNEDDPIKNEGARVLTIFSPIISLWGSRAVNSAVLGPIWPNLELVRDIMTVLVTCKNEKVLTTLNIDFSDAQGQVTPHSVVGSG